MTIDKRKEFFDLLNSLTMDTNIDKVDLEKRISIINNWVINNIPKKIYRFFYNKKRNILALKNNEVWGSLPCEFNDPYECFPFYDSNVFWTKMQETVFDSEFIFNLFKELKNGNNREIERYVLQDDKSIFQCQLDDLNNKITNDDDLQIFSEFVSNINKIILLNNQDYMLDKFRGDFLYYCYITCFSELRDDMAMWGHYANSHKGFCVEYDFSELIKEELSKNINDIKWFISPVFYNDKRYDATSYCDTLVQQILCMNSPVRFYSYYQDLLQSIKILTNKSISWSYEKEWRLFSLRETSNSLHFKKQLEIVPKAVYIGFNMPKYWSNWINKICKEKNIPCYKMLLVYNDKEYVLTPVLYTDYIKNLKEKEKFLEERKNKFLELLNFFKVSPPFDTEIKSKSLEIINFLEENRTKSLEVIKFFEEYKNGSFDDKFIEEANFIYRVINAVNKGKTY